MQKKKKVVTALAGYQFYEWRNKQVLQFKVINRELLFLYFTLHNRVFMYVRV